MSTYRGIKMGIQIPVIHLNGTSKQELLRLYDDAFTKLESAYQALKQAAPNGRDYYIISPRAISSAQSDHQNWLRMIDSVKGELEEMMKGIDAQ